MPFQGGFQWGDAWHVLSNPAILSLLAVGFVFGFFGLARMRMAHGAMYYANLICLPFFIAILFERSFEDTDWEVWLGILLLRFLVYGAAVWLGRQVGYRHFGFPPAVCPGCGRPLGKALLASEEADLRERLCRHRRALAQLCGEDTDCPFRHREECPFHRREG